MKLFLAVVALLATLSAASAQNYDLVILNGRMIDPETRLDAIRNVGIRGDRITAISEFPIDGDTVIDAAGHVVAPGFIDLHAHGFNLAAMRMQAMQGVTTLLELESGVLPIADWYATKVESRPMMCWAVTMASSRARLSRR